MKRISTITASTLLACSIFLSGCGTMSRADLGTIGGGVAGGALGAAVTRGSPVGAIVGTLGGAYVGRYIATGR